MPASRLVQARRCGHPVDMDVDKLNGELRDNGAAVDGREAVHVLWQLLTA
jgi:hypothetical protein